MNRLVTVINESRCLEAKALREKLRKKGVSIKKLNRALRQMVDYFGQKEEDDFFEADHTANLDQHIYWALVVVEEYLRGRR